MSKVVIFVRVSTDAQSTEAQREEMITFCIGEGYSRDNQIILEEQGASAIKLNDKYMAMINGLKETIINDTSIDCIAFWAMDRLWRTEKVYVDLKEFLVARKIQMIVKNPYLKLLNADGTVNGGMEIAFSLMTVLAQQEMQTKKDRFARAKKALAQKGISLNGRNHKKFGYKVDENRYFVPDDGGTAETVRLIFNLYSQGTYSCKGIEDELESRGIKREDGARITEEFIDKILKSKPYYGEPTDKGRVYPPIITKELFDKVAEVRESNKLEMRRRDDFVLGSKLIKCAECGGTYTSSSKHYSCCKNRRYNKANEHKCENTLTLNKEMMDKLLWRVAYINHIDYLLDMSEGKVKEYTDKIKALEQKEETIEDKINKANDKKSRIIETYMEGFISKEDRDKKLAKVDTETEDNRKELSEIRQNKFNLQLLIDSVGTELEEDRLLLAVDEVEGNEVSLKYKYDIIHKHIEKVVAYRDRLNADSRNIEPFNAQRIEIHTVNGGLFTFLYIPYSRKCRLYSWNGKEWTEDKL